MTGAGDTWANTDMWAVLNQGRRRDCLGWDKGLFSFLIEKRHNLKEPSPEALSKEEAEREVRVYRRTSTGFLPSTPRCSAVGRRRDCVPPMRKPGLPLLAERPW